MFQDTINALYGIFDSGNKVIFSTEELAILREKLSPLFMYVYYN